MAFASVPSDEDLSLGTPVAAPKKTRLTQAALVKTDWEAAITESQGVVCLRIDFRNHRAVCSQDLRRER